MPVAVLLPLLSSSQMSVTNHLLRRRPDIIPRLRHVDCPTYRHKSMIYLSIQTYWRHGFTVWGETNPGDVFVMLLEI